MNRKLLLFLSLNVFFLNNLFSQNYGNEWINYDQTYYKFPLITEGIYKIDYQTLQTAGVNMNGINSATFQIFGRDKQQPIYIVDGNDGVFGSGDYFMFHVERNNGWLDSSVYEDPNSIGNPYYCMFNDTINYFFSISTTTNNLRYILETTTTTALDVTYPIVAPFCLAKTEFAANSNYNEGKIKGGTYLSQYSPGEGLATVPVDGGNTTSGYSTTFSFNTPNVYPGSNAPQAVFHGKANSNSDATSPIFPLNHHLKWTLGIVSLADTIFGGYQQTIVNKLVPLYNLTAPTTNTTFNIVNDIDALRDFQSFSYMSLIYPRLTNLSGANKDRFTVKFDPFRQKEHLEIISTGISNPIMFARGTSNSYFIQPISAGGNNWRAIVPTNGQDCDVIFQDASTVLSVPSIRLINETGVFTNFDEIVLDSADLMIYHPSLDSASHVYADYRRSTSGGTYNVVMANIEELYLQFGGGIPKHNAAIRRFSHYAYNNSNVKPVALTLLGKGYTQQAVKNAPYFYSLNVIPPFGHPGSDVCYTSALEGSGFAPLIPTGRISVDNQDELLIYLEKLKIYEEEQNQSDVYNNETKDWQKQILHFSGGNPGQELNFFFSYLESFRSIIENAYFAGHVTTYRKLSTDPLAPSILLDLKSKLKSGVSLINFYGHSSANGFDLSIDSPENWDNFRKYPIVIGNGCHSGAIFESDDASFGEKLIRAPQEGAIAYIGSTDSEYTSSVNDYCSELYSQMSPKNYGLPIGQQMQKTIQSLQVSIGDNYLLKGTLGATNLNGDPLLRLNWHTKPEIHIIEESLYFNPTEVDLDDDSIEVNLVIKNLGKAVTDTFQVDITRRFPNGSEDSIYTIQYSSLNYVDTLRLKIPTQASIATGINTITANVDLPDNGGGGVIEEQYDEINNNGISKSLFLKLDVIIPIWPYEFAVIPNKTVTLKASTVNPIGELRTYRFEVDTTDEFNSTKKLHKTFSAVGGVKEVKFDEWLDEDNLPFDFICADSAVYFWRTAIDSSTLVWNESSFQYIDGKEGWGQDHFFQFKKNNFTSVQYDRVERKRNFQSFPRELVCDVYDHASNVNLTRYLIDGQQIDFGMWYLTPSLHLVVIDPITLKPWKNINNSPGYPDLFPGHYLGNANHMGAARYWRQENYFIYRQDATGLNNLKNALLSIPDGYYVMVYSVNYADYSQWDIDCPTLYTTLNNLGSSLIQPGLDENSFIFFSRVGDISRTQEVLTTVVNEKISLIVDIISTEYNGVETSTLIGPSAEWKTLYWKQHPFENIVGDSTVLEVEMYNFEGVLASSFDTLFTFNDSIIDLQNLIDASIYPYIKLKAKYTDTVTFTPAQNDRWHVLYSPMPEAAIDGSAGYTWIPGLDTLNEGEKFKFAVDIKNISTVHMDSLLVSYYVEDENHVKNYINYPRQDSLKITETMRDTIEISTVGLPGYNSLWVEVNPYVNGSLVQTDQLEQYHFNNLLQIPFYVNGDDVNPILDVTFDGRHILNGDIVNPKSEIYISLKDDNDFLVMNDISDTTLFGVFLTTPDGTQKRIPFMDGNGNQVMQWLPADSQYKKFKIIYTAAFEVDGIYELFIQGADRSGNLSGDLEYRIKFEVIHESSITALMNYPNPFSTSTRFVFTLTGSEVPDEFLIQIMTVSGKVVREITEDQLGQIYIGRNITEYAWDGTDEFGDPLANGVYLYRVLSEMNGEEIKHRDSGADQYFTKDFGKMYIIR